MKVKLVFIFLTLGIFAVACRKDNKGENTIANNIVSTSDSIITVDISDVADEDAESSKYYYRSDSTVNQGVKYKAVFVDDGDDNTEFMIIRELSDTIYRDSVTGPGFYFEDFDKDGNDDIFVGYLGNITVEDLFLFEKKSKKFIQVEDFISYPQYTQIGNTKYYYSYHRSGCADYNWDSDLFYIDNYKAIKRGNISGIGCDYEDNEEELGIFIYKVRGEETKLVEKVDIDTIGSYKDYKWGFIEEYWTKKYLNFVR